MSVEDPCSALGPYALLQLKAEPLLELTPKPVSQVIDRLSRVALDVTGTCNNLAQPMSCRLTWMLEETLAGEAGDASRPHPVPCHIKPAIVDGKPGFVVQEVASDGTEGPVSLSPFDLNLCGEGKLGYSLRVGDLTEQLVELSPERSGFRVALPVRLKPLPSGLEMGALVQLSVDCASCFKACALDARIADERALDITALQVHRSWTADELASGAKKGWYVGAADESLGHGAMPHFIYAGSAATHTFVCVMTVEEPLPPGSKSKPRTITLRAQPLVSVTHPALKELKLSLDGSSLVLSGEFSGFGDGASLSLIASVYVLLTEKSPGYSTYKDVPQPLWSYATNPVVWRDMRRVCGLDYTIEGAFNLAMSVSPSSSITLSEGQFEAPLFDLGVLGFVLLDLLEKHGVAVFATLGFPAGGSGSTGGSVRPVFANMANYGEAIGGVPAQAKFEYPIEAAILGLARGPERFAPFAWGGFAWKAIATDVCSNLVSLSGRVAQLVAPPAEIPPAMREEYEIFVATVAGEALGGSPRAWKGVACAIINRVGRFEWKKHMSITAIIANTGFDAYRNREKSNAYQNAMRHLKGKPGVPKVDLDALVKLEQAIRPFFMGTSKLITKAVIFYNPSICGFPGDRNMAVDVTADVLGSPADPLDAGQYSFWMYRTEDTAFDPGRQKWG